MRNQKALGLLMLLPALLAGQEEEDEEANRITMAALQVPANAQQGTSVTINIPVQAECKKPYDRTKFVVAAHITDPDGDQMAMPCYYLEGYEIALRRTEQVAANVQQLRFEIAPRDWPDGEKVELYVDDLKLLHSRAGNQQVLNNADAAANWSGVSLEHGLSTDLKAEGAGSIRAALTTGEAPKESPPALVLNLAQKDWSSFDTLQFQVLLKSRIGNSKFQVVLEAGEKGRYTESYSVESGTYSPDTWSRIRMRLPGRTRTSEWKRKGEKLWRLRFCPLKAGKYRIQVFAENPTHWAKSNEIEVEVAPGDGRGVVGVSPRDRAYLEFASGESFFPVGLNVCWADPVQLVTYLEKLAANGGNLVRLWMCPWNFPLEWQTAGEYDQKAAAQLDYVLEHCERLGLKALLCLDYHGALKADESWSKHPYNVANGGPCETTDEFFKSPKALRLYQRRLLYLIARYSGCSALFAWELFNEVGLTDPYRFHKRRIHDWHEAMVAFIRKNDPYKHLVTTSVAGENEWDSSLWRLEELGFVQPHQYGKWRNFAAEAAYTIERFAGHERPILPGEFGLYEEAAKNLDPSGRALHNAMWSAVTSGAAGSPMPWWWASHIDAFDLYGRFGALAKFIEKVDFPGEGFRPIREWSLEFTGETDAYGTVLIQPDRTSFDLAPFNRPQTYRVLRDGTVEGPAARAETIHGLKANPELHNPQTFEVEYPVDGAFGVFVSEVSNYGSSELSIAVDDEQALKAEFPDEDPSSGVQYRYRKVYRVPVPAGKHRITVDNRGEDWIKVAYVLEHYRGFGPKALSVQGLAGRDTALVWVQAPESVYYAPKLGIKPTPVRGAVLRIDDLPAEQWKVFVWDTAAGKVLAESVIRRKPTRIPLPPVATDIALKLRRIKPVE